MSAHNTLQEIHAASPMRDPGSGGTITIDRSPATVLLVSAAAETRTLARPTRAGAIALLVMKTDGGDITLTVTGGYNLAGATTYTFTDAGQAAMFVAGYNGSTYYWRLQNPASQQVPAEILTTTRTIRAEESGKTFYLNLAAGFVVTLPAPALGLRYKFVVMTSPTGSYTIVTSGSSNILCGQVLTLDVNSGTDPDFTATADQDTVTFVLNKSVKGDWCELESDGTSWYARASASVFDGITIDQAG